MLLNRKNVWLFFLGIIFLIAIFFVYWYFLGGIHKKSLSFSVNNNSTHFSVDNAGKLPKKKDNSSSNNFQAPSVSDSRYLSSKIEAKSLIKIFVERYFTYSSDTFHYANLREIEELATLNFQKKIKQVLQKNVSLEKDKDYFSVLTKVLSIKIDNFDENSEEIRATVYCQQKEERGRELTSYSYIQYPIYEVTLKKVSSKWLVDSLVKE